jgi:hypothetical protein
MNRSEAFGRTPTINIEGSRWLVSNWGDDVVSPAVPATNTWTHVAGIFDGSTIYLYINGALKSSASGITCNTTTATKPEIGAIKGERFFSGRIDEVRMYSRALSPAEVAALYNGGNGCSGP